MWCGLLSGYKKYVSSMYPGVFCVYSLDGVCEPGYIGIHSGYTLEYMRFFGGETDVLGGKHVCILKRNDIRDTCQMNRNTFRIHVYLYPSGIQAEYIGIQAGYIKYIGIMKSLARNTCILCILLISRVHGAYAWQHKSAHRSIHRSSRDLYGV